MGIHRTLETGLKFRAEVKARLFRLALKAQDDTRDRRGKS